MKKIFFSIIMAIAMVAGLGTSVLADGTDPMCGAGNASEVLGCNNNETTSGTLGKLINAVLPWMGIVCVIVVIVGGIYMITSNGDPAKFKKGQRTIIFGVVGLIVTLAAYTIVRFVLEKVQ